MALTQTDLDNLDAAIAAAELTVEVNGRRVTYRSIDELMRARAHVASLLTTGDMQGAATRRGTFSVRFTTARGY